MSSLEQLRASVIHESDLIASKKRFGLFSQPISTAIGDSSPYQTKIYPRDETGKPVTQPRNIYVSPIKSGQLRKSYFGQLNSLATHTKHDIFIEEGIRLLKEQNTAFSSCRKESNFVPPNGINRSVTNSAYPYIQQMNPELDPRKFREEDGRVRSGPRNFYTNNNAKVAETLFKHYKYVDDPYEREHDQEMQRQRKEKAKEREDIFKPNSFNPKLLNKDSKVYGSDIQLVQVESTRFSDRKNSKPVLHASMKYLGDQIASKNRYGMFKPVHAYLENPPPQRKPSKAINGDKDTFKSMNASMLSTPSPSIALNKVNMIKSINRSMSLKR